MGKELENTCMLAVTGDRQLLACMPDIHLPNLKTRFRSIAVIE